MAPGASRYSEPTVLFIEIEFRFLGNAVGVGLSNPTVTQDQLSYLIASRYCSIADEIEIRK